MLDATALGRGRLVLVAVAALVVVSGCAAVGGSPSDTRIQFQNATQESGLDYADDRETGIGNGNAGVYVLDYDRDGWQDVLAVGAERPALFHNTGGQFAHSGALPPLSRSFKSATVVDYDGDGWQDVLLFPAGEAVVVLHNDHGSFERTDGGLGNVTYPLGGAAADYDGDGDHDLLLYQSGNWANGKPAGYFSLNSTIESDNGNPNVLYENVGGEFRRVNACGIEGTRWSLAASFVDLTGDGRPDIHVANDYNNDVVYVNEGDGCFKAHLLGGATARNGMASEVADVTGDGRPDVFVSNIYLPLSPETLGSERYDRIKRFLTYVVHSNRTKGNTLLVNRGEGEFVDRADQLGVRHGGWGWAASFVDLDNDGDRDLVHTTQNVVRIDREDPVYTYPMLWEHGGDGFEQLNASDRGLSERNGRGMVAVDYDRDGDRDLISATYGGQYTVHENTVTNATHSLQFRVVDRSGTTALGATVTVEHGGEESVVRQHSRTDYLSQEPRVRHVGLGSATTVDLTVTWPDGTRRQFEDVPVDRRIVVTKQGLETVTTFEDGSERT